ncbi:MAG: TonB-dependent receptor plug domain-containing protein [Candidatus Cryptobacteroides sp.]
MKYIKYLLVSVLLVLPLFKVLAQEGDKVDTLSAAIVQTEKDKRMARTQTSLKTVDKDLLKRGFAVLGSPDLIKTMQILPGVASGTELVGGFYVRGGDGSDNLYLLDGVPMYQVSHVLGLFSSFNVDVVEDADFYKGGFPARYGGRLSSVVDVNVRDGNFEEWKGSASIGLLDGRFQIEGPVIKDKLALNFGIRRSWIDIVKTLVTPLVPAGTDRDIVKGSTYDFTDLNLKLTQNVREGSKLSFSFYGGHDLGKLKVLDQDGDYQLDVNTGLQWGNLLASLKWDKKILYDDFFFDTNIYYTNFTSDISVSGQEGSASDRTSVDEANFSRIHDLGANLNFYLNLLKYNRIRFGASLLGHIYDPYRESSYKLYKDGELYAENSSGQGLSYRGGELAFYMEDEISIGRVAKLNLGLRDNVFLVGTKNYNRLEPRIALRVDVNEDLLLKASYSETNQFAHQLSATYMDLPTNIWMPSTERIKPMNAKQWVLGFKCYLPKNLSLDVELWHKDLKHIYEYQGLNSFLPAIEGWESRYYEGVGRADGMEIGLEYKSEKLFAAAYYTFSKSMRYFPDIFNSWYPDRNDNRHKLNLHCQYQVRENFEIYAAWIFHSGNRFTAATAVAFEDWGHYLLSHEYCSAPNQYSLPAYHRLDVGMNWHKKLKNGKSRTLNLSLYNAYCHINAMSGSLVITDNNELKGNAYGFIPIIPSISYLWTF